MSIRCPYPPCNSATKIKTTPYQTAICLECSFPIILCPQCKGTNRSVHRRCRKCGEILEYSDILLKWLNLLADSPLAVSVAPERVPLAPAAGPSRTVLNALGGYLACITQDSLFLLNPETPREILYREALDESGIMGTAALENNRAMLINTRKKLYCLKLFPFPHISPVGDLPAHSFISGLTVVGEEWFGLTVENNGNRPLMAAGNVNKPDQLTLTDFSLSGRLEAPSSEAPIQTVYLGDDDWFLVTVQEAMVYNLKGDRIVWQGLSGTVDSRCRPVHDAGSQEVYLAGVDGRLWRFVRDCNQAFPVGSQTFSQAQLAIVSDQKCLVISHSNGLTLVDAIVGNPLWDLGGDARITLFCGGLPAQVWGHLVLFWGASPRGGMDMGVLSLHRPHYYQTIQGLGEIMAPPVLSLGRWAAAVLKDQGVELAVYSLSQTQAP